MVRYFDLVREMKNPFNYRLRLVESARQRGIKPTVRLFATAVDESRYGGSNRSAYIKSVG
jgi:hypothetical protein